MRSARLLLTLGLIVVSVVSRPTTAEAAPWQAIGPWGGPVRTLAASRVDRDLLLAVSPAGVFRSDDGGGRWHPANDGLADDQFSIRVLLFSPIDPGLAWAGGNGPLFRTDDGGETWQAVPGIDLRILQLLADRDGRLFALVGQAEGPPGRSRVLGSLDGGESWRLLRRLVTTIALDRDGRLFAVSTERGLFRSDDGGNGWVRVDVPTALPFIDPDVLVVAPDRANMIYAGVDRQLWRSTDGGRTWTLRSADPLPGSIRTLDIPPGRPRWLLAGTSAGLLRSRDRGQSFQPLGVAPIEGEINDLAVIGARGALLLQALSRTDIGVWLSTDSGNNWSPAVDGIPGREGTAYARDWSDSGSHLIGAGSSLWRGKPGDLAEVAERPAGRITELATDPTLPGVVFAAAEGRLFRSMHTDVPFEELALPAGFGVSWLDWAPGGGRIVAGPQGPLASDDLGETWHGLHPADDLGADRFHRLVRDPDDPAHLVIGTDLYFDAKRGVAWNFFESFDDGDSWQQLEPPGSPLAFEAYFAFAQGHLLFVGTEGLWRRLDGSWEALPVELSLDGVFSDGSVLYGTDRRRPSRRDRVRRSTDGGSTWIVCDQGLDIESRHVLRSAPGLAEGVVWLGPSGVWVRTGGTCR